MNLIAFLVILFGLQAICFYVGKKSSQEVNNQDDYFLAGKGIKFYPLMMTAYYLIMKKKSKGFANN